MSDKKFSETTERTLSTAVDTLSFSKKVTGLVRNLMEMAFIEGKAQGAKEFKAAIEKEFPSHDSQ